MINNGSKEIAKEPEELNDIIKEVKKDVCVYVLVVLQSVIKEQVSIKQLKKDTGNYIYQAIKDQMLRRQWISEARIEDF